MLRFLAAKCADLPIRLRLSAAFALVLALTVGMTVIGMVEMAQINDARHVMKMAASSTAMAQRWLGAIEANLARTYAIAKSEDVADRQFFGEAMRKGSAEVSDIQKRLQAQIDRAGEQGMREVAIARSQYVTVRDKVFALQKGGAGESEVDAMVQATMVPAMKTYVGAVQAVVAHQEEAFAAADGQIDAVYAHARAWLVGVGGIAVLIGALFAWMLSRSIVNPLGSALRLARAVATGDLTMRIDATSRDELGQLKQALQSMNDSLLRTVLDVRLSSETIASASQEIATGNLDLSSRTETQASSLQQTAASLEELTGTVKQNAEHAREASALAVTASSIAERGGAMVADVVSTMAAISTSSRRIEDIIGVIDGIAFQTNILALNAAVEAARAGEQGRGFAVVASEVRTLAQRSAGAAKDIKTLIGESVATVDAGSRLVGQTGDTMSDIVRSIGQVTALMGQIATATLEQTTGLDQINVAVTQMDDVTQQNAALVEQAAAAAASLDEQAQRLVRAVGVFTTEDATRPRTARIALTHD